MTVRLDQMPEWRSLADHARHVEDRRVVELFREDSRRFEHFSCSAAGLFLDYSRHNVDRETRRLLMALAHASDLEDWRNRLFRGEKINLTENRAVLHTAFRAEDPSVRNSRAPGFAIDQANETLLRMEELVGKIRSGKWRGHTGRTIRTVIVIGIGGSHLGPALACQALSTHSEGGPEIRFLSNVDPIHFREVTLEADPESTLFILASKSFSTLETMVNAEEARKWLGIPRERRADNARHWIAVTGNNSGANAWGIASENIFPIPDWIGGRFSLWSAMGIPIALAIGMEGFRALLRGGGAMDTHFLEAPFERNLPVLMAMVGIWNRNFLGSSSLAVVPYAQNLELLPTYLQQMEMESNGKRVTRYGEEVSWATCPVIWGAAGTNAQHTFFQQLHQGSETIPVDFVMVSLDPASPENSQWKLLANAISQSAALMLGQDEQGVRRQLAVSGRQEKEEDAGLIPHRVHPGNRPSSMIILETLSPETLGALIALYEHKVFVQGIVWQVCSYDQWGVELGKELVSDMERMLAGGVFQKEVDGSTRGLLSWLKRSEQ